MGGLGVASAIYFSSRDTYDPKIDAAGADAKWAFLSAWIFCVLTTFINFYPMIYKSRVLPDGKDPQTANLRANMYLYRTTKTGETVVLDEGPDAGKYNRANRSLHHFTEYAPAFIAGVVFAVDCFPVPTFALVVVFSIGRLLHQIGYTNGGYGFKWPGHAPGFMLHMFAANTLNGLLLIAAVRGFGGL